VGVGVGVGGGCWHRSELALRSSRQIAQICNKSEIST
jgi:hypothetical protein